MRLGKTLTNSRHNFQILQCNLDDKVVLKGKALL